jgi:acid phosphatase
MLTSLKIHRHHKRTPYESNLFPAEGDRWNCQDAELYHYGQPKGGHKGARTFWQIEYDSLNPFSGKGINSSCSFPQITSGGLEDSWQHGQDLFGVYHDLLNFLPASLDTNQVHFRVTNNVITSEVAGMVIAGMYTGQPDDVRLHIQVGLLLTSIELVL